MARTKVLYLVNEFADGSSNNLVLTLINGMDHDRFEFFVGGLKAMGGPLEERFRQAGADVVNFNMAQGRLGLKLIGQIARTIDAHDIDILHTHVMRPDILGGIAARRSRCHPVVISTKHNMAYVRGQTGWRVRNMVYWPAMRASNHVVTVTELLRQQAIQKLHLRPDRITTIYNGIDTARFYQPDARDATRAGLGIGPDAFVMTYTGRLIGGKGIEDLLRATARLAPDHPHARALIVGEGELDAPLKQLVAELGITDQVVFSGFRRDIPAVLAASDVFVLPSFSEGLPLSLLEAMAANKPVVASRVGGIPEVVTDGETGLLIEPGDVPGLAAALASLMDDPDRSSRIGAQGRQHVQDHFSVAQMVGQYQALYEAYSTR
ncbi:MAG TPA: glycosyltransferase family 4 protein [Aggregatilinea sp.]|uniref:glycosyltransferase family 4 protein n=1 Tax=Aggregatilinea sp. TaxID=2806333 RepID=UPI002D0DE94A|nr:glycosyltransferase family 4 protein [Aggregatilinea sp.]HML20749.1 glycosyltransferase family 4 protein [Aggregatilinea sp.]